MWASQEIDRWHLARKKTGRINECINEYRPPKKWSVYVDHYFRIGFSKFLSFWGYYNINYRHG